MFIYLLQNFSIAWMSYLAIVAVIGYIIAFASGPGEFLLYKSLYKLYDTSYCQEINDMFIQNIREDKKYILPSSLMTLSKTDRQSHINLLTMGQLIELLLLSLMFIILNSLMRK